MTNKEEKKVSKLLNSTQQRNLERLLPNVEDLLT